MPDQIYYQSLLLLCSASSSCALSPVWFFLFSNTSHIFIRLTQLLIYRFSRSSLIAEGVEIIFRPAAAATYAYAVYLFRHQCVRISNEPKKYIFILKTRSTRSASLVVHVLKSLLRVFRTHQKALLEYFKSQYGMVYYYYSFDSSFFVSMGVVRAALLW